MHDCYKPVKRRDALFIIGDVDQPHQSRDYERNPMMQRVSFLSIPSVLDADADDGSCLLDGKRRRDRPWRFAVPEDCQRLRGGKRRRDCSWRGSVSSVIS